MSQCRITRIAGLALSLMILAQPDSALAQAQNLDAGKSGAKLFADTCSTCHRSPQGLAKGRAAGTLSGFLRRHYTTGPQSASDLATYLAGVDANSRSSAQTRSAAEARAAEAKAVREAAEKRKQAAAQPQQKPEAKPEPRKPEAKPEAKPQEPAARQAAVTPAPPPRRPRTKGEPAAVAGDPEPVTIAREPVAVVHNRAASRAQEQRPAPVLPKAALAKPEAPKPETAKSDPVNPEPGKSEPGKSEPAKAAEPVATASAPHHKDDAAPASKPVPAEAGGSTAPASAPPPANAEAGAPAGPQPFDGPLP